MNYDVIIIGGGLGGLECGYILARHGLNVCVLEQHTQVGGCLQTFRRKGITFDTGFHYVGGLGEGESLYPFFRYFGLLDLPWQRMDDLFDEVIIGERPYFFANGHERFVDTLAESFPHQRKQLETYTAFLKTVGQHLLDVFNPDVMNGKYVLPLFGRSAYEFLHETIDDPLLRKVLSGTSLKMELDADKLPLYTFAQIHNSYIQSAWRLRGGGSQIADRLVRQIEAMGGTVRPRAGATRLIETNGRITAVEVNGDEQLTARFFISNAHPAYTYSILEESRCIRKAFRKRITHLPNTAGVFTANVRLRPDSVPYCNRNIYLHDETSDLWRYRFDKELSGMFISYKIPENGDSYTPNIDLLTPMSWAEVERWKDRPRDADYAAIKRAKAEACIAFAVRRLPWLRDAVEEIYTSTPLSYRRYTNTVDGSAYGIRKDCTSPISTVLMPRTPIPNLFLTGQNLSLHGILGVSVTSFFTCAEILGMKTVTKDFRRG